MKNVRNSLRQSLNKIFALSTAWLKEMKDKNKLCRNKSDPIKTTVHLVTNEPQKGSNKKQKRRYHRGKVPKKDTLQADMVANPSTYQLTKYEISVLSKGLKFIPTPTSIKKTELSATLKNLTEECA